MIKRVILVLIVVTLSAIGIDALQENISRQWFDHIEAGNFINTNNLSDHNVTMLHWFSKEVQVYSEESKTLHFLVIEPSSGWLLYKNKSLIMQNESDKYPYFQKGDHTIFFIEGNDYNKKRVDLYIERTSNTPNTSKYGSSFFVGDHNQINRVLVIYKSVEFIILFVLLMAAILVIVVHKKDIYGILLGLSGLILLFDFEVGMVCTLLILYLYADKLFKKRVKKYFLILLPLLCMLFTSDYFPLYVGIMMFIGLRNYYKYNGIKTLIAFATLTVIFAFNMIDFEFSFFKLFYESFQRIFIAIILLIISLLNLRMYFSREKLIRIDLLRGMSHDIRVPLSTIKLNAEILSKGDFESKINRGKTLHIINGAVDDLTNLTAGLTSYISSDMYVGNNYRTCIQDCIGQSIGYFSNNEKHIDIKSDIYNDELFLPIDKVWLNRLIYNILDNAYKYTDEYGEIIVNLSKEKKVYLFSVEDNGIGMKSDQVVKVLEPFYRADNSRNISGFGLGLSVVKSIVENLEGEISIVSELGRGTKISIRV